MDALFAYQQYRLMAEKNAPSTDRNKFKNQLLMARLKRPSHPKPAITSPNSQDRKLLFVNTSIK
jgi:hypothetical protein